jgi:hypothetical protein
MYLEMNFSFLNYCITLVEKLYIIFVDLGGELHEQR